MLKELIQRIENGASQAVNSPIRTSHVDYYWSRRLEGLTADPDYEYVRGEYETASVSFSYPELQELTQQEFLQLQQQLQAAITSALAREGQVVPNEVARFIIPGDKKNVLTHEVEHIEPLPEVIKQEASIDVIMCQRDLGGTRDIGHPIVIDGISAFNWDIVTYTDKALSSSAPQSLSKADIDDARYYANKTQDGTFIAVIEQRISERDQH
jgi:hypothetical protein